MRQLADRLAFAIHRRGADAQMNGRNKLDALFFIGPAIDAQVDPVERQMIIEPLEPSVANRVKLLDATGP